MLEFTMDLRARGRPAPAWRAYPGKRVRVLAPEGSYAAQRAPVELREAERARDALDRLLTPEETQRAVPVDIYLSDPLAAGMGGPADPNAVAIMLGSEVILRVVQPEAPGEPISYPLTRLLLARWFGRDQPPPAVFFAGIAGLVAARTGRGPSPDDAHAWARVELLAGRTPALLTGAADPRAALSFVAWLVEQFGPGAMRQFLATYDPARRDQAAVAAFQRPLGALEEVWRAGVRRGPNPIGSLATFIRPFVPLLRPYWSRQLGVLGFMVVGLVYNIVVPLASKYLIDNIIPTGDVGRLGGFLAGLLAIYGINTLAERQRSRASAEIIQRVTTTLQERIFSHLQRLGHDFYGRAKVGDIMARFGGDLFQVQLALTGLTGTGIYMALSATVAAITLILLNTLLGVLVLIVIPLFVLIYRALRARLVATNTARQKLVAELVTSIQENLLAHAVVKAFGLEARAVATYHARMLRMLDIGKRVIVINTLFETSTALAITLAQLLVLGVGGYLAMTGGLTVGTLLAFIGLLSALFQPVSALAAVSQQVQTASGALERITELLNEPVTVADRPGASTLPPLNREIRLEDVNFNYGGDRPILCDFNLRIPAGTHVAIVGPSGSGKSTMATLLMRFWDPAAGRVLFDDADIRDGTLTSLRGQIGVVFQDTFVFDTTLRENIALGRPGATDEEIMAAARAARLESYVNSLPAGYDTVLGERGARMSGGQRQRLALARVLLRNPRLLILDEATSALDPQTEREILETLGQVTRGRTTINITHRLSLAATADRIVVLEAGQVAEEGTHSDLLAAGGLYSRLYAEQTGTATVGGRPRLGAEAARLRAIPLFAALEAPALATLADQLIRERYPAGEDVVVQGEPGDKLYIISRGQAEVLIADEAGSHQVNTLNEGDYFGEMALLDGAPRAATVRTMVPTDFYTLAQADFHALLEQEPAFRIAVTATVAGRRLALDDAAAAVAAAA